MNGQRGSVIDNIYIATLDFLITVAASLGKDIPRTDPMRVHRFSITPWMTLHDFIEIMKPSR